MALIGKTNAERIWNFCKSKGMNDYGVSVVLANMDAESGLNPKNLQDSYEKSLGFNDETYTALVDSGVYTKTQFIYDRAGYSLCQWTYWSRKKALYEFVKSKNKSIGDLETVLEFFYKELSENYTSVLNVLKTATSLEYANNIMVSKYECPANVEDAKAKRLKFARKYYTQFVSNTTTKTEGVVNMGYKYYTKGVAVKISTHFYSTEFDCRGNGCCSQTKINEKLIVYLEQIREHFNAPITITSAYRCQIHNQRVGGAVGSRHTKADAVDIVVKGHHPREVAQYCESIGIKGIGLYETATDGYFVHIDTRDYKSFWYGQAEQPRTTFGVYVYNNVTSNGDVSNNVQNTNTLNTILNQGDRGSSVKTLQEKLIKLGYSCGSYGADGDFGNGTYQAVRKFQKDYGLGVDGIAGNQTLIAIDKAIEKLNKENNSNCLAGCEVKVTANLLNVRAGAGANYRIVKQIKKNTVCKVLEEQNDWCKIESPTGWVSKDYIKKI